MYDFDFAIDTLACIRLTLFKGNSRKFSVPSGRRNGQPIPETIQEISGRLAVICTIICNIFLTVICQAAFQ